MKGLMVAQALIQLEKTLGDKPLIEHPNLKVLVGTSTGAIISASIAMGMRAKDIADLYVTASHEVFPRLDPGWFPRWLRMVAFLLRGLIRPSQYSPDGLEDLLKRYISKCLGKDDATLADLHNRLTAQAQNVIFTTGEIGERMTHFLKTNDSKDGGWELWRAVLASSSAPSVFPVVTRQSDPDSYYTDGGVGAQGNPANIAAQEMIEWYGIDPSEITIFSFGTGWQNRADYLRAVGTPDKWRLPDWATNAPIVIIQDMARVQSVEVLHNYLSRGLDFRRFQIRLTDDFDPFAAVDENNQKMVHYGDELGKRIQENQHALANLSHSDPDFDPEGLVDAFNKYNASRQRGRACGETIRKLS